MSRMTGLSVINTCSPEQLSVGSAGTVLVSISEIPEDLVEVGPSFGVVLPESLAKVVNVHIHSVVEVKYKNLACDFKKPRVELRRGIL